MRRKTNAPAVVLDAGGEGLEAEDARARVEEVPHVVKVVERHQVRPQDALLVVRGGLRCVREVERERGKGTYQWLLAFA
jgi:uridylate kinase